MVLVVDNTHRTASALQTTNELLTEIRDELLVPPLGLGGTLLEVKRATDRLENIQAVARNTEIKVNQIGNNVVVLLEHFGLA